MRIPRWLDGLILTVGVFATAAVCCALLVPVLVADRLRARRRPKVRVEPLPNPPWSVRDQWVAIERQREWMQ